MSEPRTQADLLAIAEFQNRCGDPPCEARRVGAAIRVLGGWKEHADYAWAVEAFEVEIGIRKPEDMGREPDNIPSRAAIEAEALPSIEQLAAAVGAVSQAEFDAGRKRLWFPGGTLALAAALLAALRGPVSAEE